MTIDSIISMGIKKGTYVNVTFKTNLKTLKAFKNCVVEKVTRMVVRFGIDYYNTKFAKNENGVNENTGKAKFIGNNIPKSWVIENLISKHDITSREYLHLYPTRGGVGVLEQHFYINGVETTKQELLDNKVISSTYAKPSNGEIGVMTIPLENIISINLR